jgi:uridine kinase
MGKNPFFIAIAGPSCSGKSSLARLLAQQLSGDRVSIISLDDYYRDLSALPHMERAAYNFDAPDALDDQLIVAHLTTLAQGMPVERPKYDFANHIRSQHTETVYPADWIVVEGILALYWQELNRLYDLKIFIRSSTRLCLERRVDRDVRERGRTSHSVIAQYQTSVLPMYERFVLPTADHSDLLLSGEQSLNEAADLVIEQLSKRHAQG